MPPEEMPVVGLVVFSLTIIGAAKDIAVEAGGDDCEEVTAGLNVLVWVTLVDAMGAMQIDD